MAITSEIIGSLHTPGFGFLVNSPSTYALPKFPFGASIMVVRWGGSGTMSYDILDRETGEVLGSERPTSFAFSNNIPATAIGGVITRGALFRINNSTPTFVYIIPNVQKTPPVWNG